MGGGGSNRNDDPFADRKTLRELISESRDETRKEYLET